MYWNYLVFIICLILAAFTVVTELRRANRQRLALRIFASILAVAAIFALTIPVSLWHTTQVAGNEVVLLTPGFKKDSLSKFKRDSIFTADPLIHYQIPKIKLITLDQFQNSSPALSAIHILGYGLNQNELKELDSLPVVFHPSPCPSGITSISWTAELKQGQRFIAQGTFNNTGDSQIRLLLKDLNTGVDSLIINPHSIAPFELTDLPKGAGKAIDQLIAINGNDTLENEKLPIEVQPVSPLKILLISGSPGFENKFLKNWLGDNGFSVAWRSGISKNKFSTEFINMSQAPLAQLSPSVLGKFDVLITDVAVLNTPGSAENTLIKNQVVQNGLGLIVSADTIFKTPVWAQDGFTVYKAMSKDPKGVLLNIAGEKNIYKILDPGQLFISPKEGTQTLISDKLNRVIAGVKMTGTGKIVFSTAGDTYKWMLSGNKESYAALWSMLIGKAVKAAPLTESWQYVNTFPVVNNPVTLQVENALQPGPVKIDDINLNPLQNSDLPFDWQFSFWPYKSGWQAIKNPGQTNWLYVFDADTWTTIKAAGNIMETRKYVSNTMPGGVTKQIHQKVTIPVPKVYFYILLLLCCTYLWLEAKISSN